LGARSGVRPPPCDVVAADVLPAAGGVCSDTGCRFETTGVCTTGVCCTGVCCVGGADLAL
jgi:hypothetical protein